MAGDSQATFSQSVKARIRETYDYRCVICLNFTQTSQCAHIIDAAMAGQQQFHNAVELGILCDDYRRNAETNGMVLCPTCHSYFTSNYIVLSLPIPILQYLLQYVSYTHKAKRKPLHEVFDLLVEASMGTAVELPDTKPNFPFLGLFTMVTLKPTQVTGCRILTPHLPRLSIIRGSKFVKAPSNTLPTAEKAARIFQSHGLDNDTSLSLGIIPLSPQDQTFTERRYWRLPVSSAAIFAALIERLAHDSSKCEDIKLARSIHDILSLQSLDAYPLDNDAGPSSGGGGPSRGHGSSGGGRQGGRGSKRKDTGSSSPSGKGKKKAPKASGSSDGTGDCSEPINASDFPPNDWSLNGQSQEIVSSLCNMGDEAPVKLIDTGGGWNDTESDGGRSVTAVSPHEKDDPDTWRFGPLFSTNKIVFTARAVNLTL